MKLERKHALVLLGIAAWDVVTWATFIRNLSRTEGRPAGYYIAHSVLIVVNLGIAGLMGRWGLRAFKEAEKEGREEVLRSEPA